MDGMIGKALGKYQIIEPLGEGGMATVYKAYDPMLERYVAIKIIRTIDQADPSFLLRFQREARALAKLDHPYILKVLDYGEEFGVPYLVMPYIAHGTLKKFTRAHLPYEQALNIILPIADALNYAHKRRIIHRDIKPANILFGESGEPILSDFGIAKILDAHEQTQLTSTGLGIGTPAYMAPEQWNGIVDERTDVYALGIVLYELITGRCPFQAETPAAILIKQVQDPLPRPKLFAPNLPQNVEAVILKALAKDPVLRFQTMQEFMTAINVVLHGNSSNPFIPPQSIADSPTQISSQSTASSTLSKGDEVTLFRKKWVRWVIGGGIIAVIACVFLIVIFGVPQYKTKIDKRAVTGTNTQPTLQNSQDAQSTISIPSPSSPRITDSKPTSLSKHIATDQPVRTPLPSLDHIEKMPEDIPVFTPNHGDVTTTQAEKTLMFNYSTSEDITLVHTFFRDEMKKQGWELISSSEVSAQDAFMYAYSKDTRNIVIYISNLKEQGSMIQVIVDNGS